MNSGLKASGQGGLLKVVVSQDDFFFRLARGEIPNARGVNVVGRNVDVDKSDVPEDVWDGGSSVNNVFIWLPPTTARIHDIVSTDALDDGAPVGTGARTIRITGLVDWDLPEVTEELTLDGLTNVPTVNAYVIIYRMEILTFGSLGTNAGTITAIAQTDATITAQIEIGFGGTLMGIYAIPRRDTLLITKFYVNWNKISATSGAADVNLLVNQRPDQADGGFIQRAKLGMFGSGNTYAPQPFGPYLEIPGPALLKIQVEDTSEDNVDMVAGFDAVVVTD